jgi:hypothetical protein
MVSKVLMLSTAGTKPVPMVVVSIFVQANAPHNSAAVSACHLVIRFTGVDVFWGEIGSLLMACKVVIEL